MAANTGAGALGPRGKALWRALHDGLSAGRLELLLEACRCADRLERLNQLLLARSDQWARLTLPRGEEWLDDPAHDHIEVQLVVSMDGLLAEARQQEQVLRQLLLAVEPEAKTSGARPPAPAPGEGDDDISARIRARRAADGLPSAAVAVARPRRSPK